MCTTESDFGCGEVVADATFEPVIIRKVKKCVLIND